MTSFRTHTFARIRSNKRYLGFSLTSLSLPTLAILLRSFLFVFILGLLAFEVAALDSPGTVYAGELVTIEFSSEALFIDGSLVSSNSPYYWQTREDDVGVYVIDERNGSIIIDNATLSVLANSEAIVVYSPKKMEFARPDVAIEVEPNIDVDLCYYVYEGAAHSLEKTGQRYYGELIVDDGVHSLIIKCKSGSTIFSQEKIFLVDTTPPEVIDFSPEIDAEVSYSEVQLELETDEVSSCSYWKANENSSDAKKMDSSSGLSHTAQVTLTDGKYYFYALCEDLYGNKQTFHHRWSFTIDNLPQASIDLKGYEDGELLTIGSYELLLTTSEPVQASPTLKFSTQNGKEKTIGLEQQDAEGMLWRGFLQITADLGESVGTFSFSGKGTDGSTGTTIVSGKSFLVDASAPDVPASIEAVVRSAKYVEVRWNVLPEAQKVSHYRVYRSTTPTVTLNDYLGDSKIGSYDDTQVVSGTPYFYAVLAVDDAGNYGSLSTVARTGTLSLSNDATRVDSFSDQYSDPAVSSDIEDFASKLSEAILDLESSFKRLESEPDERKRNLLSESGILSQIEAQIELLKTHERDLSSLSSLSAEQRASRLSQMSQDISSAYASVPARVELDGSISFQQPSDANIQSFLLERISLILGASADVLSSEDELKAAYQKTLQSFMDGVIVEGDISIAKVTYNNRAEKYFTLIEKTTNFPVQSAPVTIVEYLPKDVASDVGEVAWSPVPITMGQEPMVKYVVPAGSSSFTSSYLLRKRVDLSSAREVRSVVFPSISSSTPDASLVTGNAVFSMETITQYHWSYWVGALSVIMLLLYYFFMDSGSNDDLKHLLKELSAVNKRPIIVNAPGSAGGMGYINNAGSAGSARGEVSNSGTYQGTFFRAKSPRPMTYFKRKKPLASAQGTISGTAALSGSAVQSYLSSHTASSNLSSPMNSSAEFESTLSSLSESYSLLSAGDLISKAHEAINDKQYTQAKQMYIEALNRPDIHAISKTQSQREGATSLANGDVASLYYKLLLYQSISRATEAAQNSELSSLRSCLSTLEKMASRIDEENTPLFVDAQKQYSLLLRIENSLALKQDNAFA